MTANSDPYCYPGTRVLRNQRGIRDAASLERFEAEAAVRRILELIAKPIAGRFDVRHLKAIHRYLFQDVFDWAGDFRTVNISRDGHLFGLANFIEPALAELFRKLAEERFLKGTSPGTFAARAAHYLGEINAAHPFRDGNGRTQREFIRELGRRAGYLVDWSRASRQAMVAASRASSMSGQNRGLVELVRSCLG